METALTPLDFARRARKLYAGLEAVIDEDSTSTYAQFFERCDRWSAALQHFGVRPGDRVAYIAPNTRAQLESFYAVPQIGAVLVPINYRLTAEDFAYLINHSGARVVCADCDYLDAVDRIRPQIKGVEQFIALNADREGWLNYESLLQASSPSFSPAEVRESDLLTINYTSGTSGKPKGVMITHRNAYMNVVGTLVHFPMSTSDRYLWTLPMFHANGWTFVWTVTAVGAVHICLRKAHPQTIVDRIGPRPSQPAVRRSHRASFSGQLSGGDEIAVASRRTCLDGRCASRRGDHRAHRGRVRVVYHAPLRFDRDFTFHHHL